MQGHSRRASFACHCRRQAAHHRAATAGSAGQARRVQPLVGCGHGVAVHPQLLGQLTHRRQHAAGRQAALADAVADAVEDRLGAMPGARMPLAAADWPMAQSVEQIAANLATVRQRIADACARAGRDPARVRLLPVSKTVDDARIRMAVAAGCHELGENKVQEAQRKAEAMADLGVHWSRVPGAGQPARGRGPAAAPAAGRSHAGGVRTGQYLGRAQQVRTRARRGGGLRAAAAGLRSSARARPDDPGRVHPGCRARARLLRAPARTARPAAVLRARRPRPLAAVDGHVR
ncbi:hypothetical protein G6F68_011549 [Rhizopus microsporus]|nr:hypothetical protein G6F68_011549 [Rhizopus microsporus]